VFGPIVQGALAASDGMTGALHTLPLAGGFLDQPVRTMQVVAVAREVFGEKIAAESKKKGL
jgi:hypothetical protein